MSGSGKATVQATTANSRRAAERTPTPSGVLRAGLIGLGAMGRNHARVLNLLDGVELVAIMDPAPNATGPAGVPVVPDLDQLLAKRLDYAVVACPTALHEEVRLRLAAAIGITLSDD